MLELPTTLNTKLITLNYFLLIPYIAKHLTKFSKSLVASKLFMAKFALSKIESVKGKQTFEQLVIDDVKQLDMFENDLSDTTYKGEFATILAYMEYVADNKYPPETKFKDITPKKQLVKEYEFKSKHLRVYAIQKAGGKIVILGGFKNQQKSDIPSFRSLKKLYLESLEPKKKK